MNFLVYKSELKGRTPSVHAKWAKLGKKSCRLTVLKKQRTDFAQSDQLKNKRGNPTEGRARERKPWILCFNDA